jgi:hypothetical protein
MVPEEAWEKSSSDKWNLQMPQMRQHEASFYRYEHVLGLALNACGGAQSQPQYSKIPGDLRDSILIQ